MISVFLLAVSEILKPQFSFNLLMWGAYAVVIVTCLYVCAAAFIRDFYMRSVKSQVLLLLKKKGNDFRREMAVFSGNGGSKVFHSFTLFIHTKEELWNQKAVTKALKTTKSAPPPWYKLLLFVFVLVIQLAPNCPYNDLSFSGKSYIK